MDLEHVQFVGSGAGELDGSCAVMPCGNPVPSSRTPRRPPPGQNAREAGVEQDETMANQDRGVPDGWSGSGGRC